VAVRQRRVQIARVRGPAATDEGHKVRVERLAGVAVGVTRSSAGYTDVAQVFNAAPPHRSSTVRGKSYGRIQPDVDTPPQCARLSHHDSGNHRMCSAERNVGQTHLAQKSREPRRGDLPGLHSLFRRNYSADHTNMDYRGME